jgi:hypothetical protein
MKIKTKKSTELNFHTMKRDTFIEYIYNSDLKEQDLYGNTALNTALYRNRTLKLSENDWDFLFSHSDTLQYQKNTATPPIVALFFNNKTHKINISLKNLTLLLNQADLKATSSSGTSPLMAAFISNKREKLFLDNTQWEKLIKESNLHHKNEIDFTPLLYYLLCKKQEQINLPIKLCEFLLENSKPFKFTHQIKESQTIIIDNLIELPKELTTLKLKFLTPLLSNNTANKIISDTTKIKILNFLTEESFKSLNKKLITKEKIKEKSRIKL